MGCVIASISAGIEGFAAAPIEPEDANAPGLTVTKVGQGTVSQTPPGPTYTCGQQVQLTATPASGWT